MGLGIGWRISCPFIVSLSSPSVEAVVSSWWSVPTLEASLKVHVQYAVSHPPRSLPPPLSRNRVNSGSSAAIGDQTPTSKIVHLFSPALSPKELAGNCEQAFKICRQGRSGEEDIFALPIRSPTAAETPSGRRPTRASPGSAQKMAAAPPATEESPVSYEELNDLNAEFDDAETELSTDFPFRLSSSVTQGLLSSPTSQLVAAVAQYDQCGRRTGLRQPHTFT